MIGHALFERRRFLISAGASVLFYGMFGSSARAEPAQRILSIVYPGPFGLDPNIGNLARNLQATGAVVTDVWGPDFGALAQYLASDSFDQIYLWDLGTFPPNANAADKAALAAWWNTAPGRQNVVLDGRAGGLLMENDGSEQAFTRNIYANFAARGGGLWIGASPGPRGFGTANAYLGALGFPLFTGAFFDYVGVQAVTSEPLLTTPNPIDVQGLRWRVPGLGDFGRAAAPSGPNLVTVLSDVHENSLITTNIPEPPGFLGLGAGGALMFAARRNKR